MATTILYPGDNIIPDAVMVYDQKAIIQAPASSVFPWLIQLGKGRGGWYLTKFWERLFPKSWRASRQIQEQWQTLTVGDRVDDYGTSKDDYFDVMFIDRPNALVYKSERYGTVFTWTLMCHERQNERGDFETTVHLRFRGRIQRKGWQARTIVWGGGWLDYIFTAPMMAGLKERVEKPRLS